MSDKILVVDDEPDTVNLTKMILERKGYQVVSALDGEEALQKAESEMPDFTAHEPEDILKAIEELSAG